MFYFAWVDPQEVFSSALYVEDEQVLSIEITQSEGDFAALSIVIKNPRIGLLAPGRKVWAWLSWDNGTAVVPLFNGRLVGIPGNIHAESVTLQFIAKPSDFIEQKAALSASMRVAPYWDEIWIGNKDGIISDDTVLESRPVLWDIDRVSLTLTATDIVAGEETLFDIQENEHLYDDLSVSISKAPLVAVDVTAKVAWEQAGSGEIDFTPLFANEHGIRSNVVTDGLLKSWPKPGSNIGGGYKWGEELKVASTNPQDDPEAELNSNENSATARAAFPDGYRWQGWTVPRAIRIHYRKIPEPVTGSGVTVKIISESEAENLEAEIDIDPDLVWLDIPIVDMRIHAPVTWEAKRKRTEVAQFTLSADVQPVLTDPAGTDRLALTFSASPVDEPNEAGEMPIGNPLRSSFFKTDRGQTAFEYILLVARAKLLAGARCIAIQFTTIWEKAWFITCRHSVRIYDRRLPGGQAIGKVTDYAMAASGDGEFSIKITIAATVGYGNGVSAVSGTNTYSNGYDNPGYEVQSGVMGALDTSDIVYESFEDFDIDDDGLNLLNFGIDEAVVGPFTVTRYYPGTEPVQGGLSHYGNIVWSADGIARDPVKELETAPAKIHMELRPVSGSEFVTVFTPEVSQLMIPQTIDLEAESNA